MRRRRAPSAVATVASAPVVTPTTPASTAPAPMSADAVVSMAVVVVAMALTIGLVGWWLGSPAIGWWGPLIPLVLARERTRRSGRRRERRLNVELLALIDRLVLAVRSGDGPVRAIRRLDPGEAVAGDRVGPALLALRPMLDDLRRHRRPDEAAARLMTAGDRSVRLVGLTLATVLRSGGPAAPALARLRLTVAGMVHDDQRRAATSAQAMASASLLSALPIVFVAFTAALDPDIAAFHLRTGAGAICVGLALALGYGGWVWMLRRVDRPPSARRRRRAGGRGSPTAGDEVEAWDDLAATVDLMAVVIGAGGTVIDATDAVAHQGPDRPAAAFRRGEERRRHGFVTVDALAPASQELGPVFHPLVAGLSLAATGGAPLGVLLQRLTEDADAARRRSSEVRAARLSVRLVPPLVCCHLPAILIGALAPVVIVAIDRVGG